MCCELRGVRWAPYGGLDELSDFVGLNPVGIHNLHIELLFILGGKSFTFGKPTYDYLLYPLFYPGIRLRDIGGEVHDAIVF